MLLEGMTCNIQLSKSYFFIQLVLNLGTDLAAHIITIIFICNSKASKLDVLSVKYFVSAILTTLYL